MRVIVTARPRISVKSGIFSLNVEKVELSGEGQLLKAFELLKAKLEKEGLFSPDRKRSTPEYPSNIGLITSKDAAAFKDFTKVLKHRMGGLKVHFHHAQVQGAQAESSIVKAIETLSTYPLDLIVLTRGGGAMDDLHAFNSEEVARAIYTSSIPIVSAVGHERDITIADYVADIRASTPSNAAEIIVKDREHLLKSISRLENSIEFELAQNIRHKKERMQTLISYVNSGYYQIKDSYQVVQNRVEMFELSLKTRLENRTNQTHQNQSFIIDQVERLMYDSRQKLDFMERFIQVNNYKKNLKKGYSILRKNGTIVTSTQDVSRGDSLDVEVFDGKIQTKVQNNT